MSDLYKTSKLYSYNAKNNNNKIAALNIRPENNINKNKFSFLFNNLTETNLGLAPLKKKGEIIHYPPATKEWVNSTYSYNKNYIKTLPVADNVLNRLIKSYLNMDFKTGKKTKHAEIRLKRLSLNRIIVSKAEVKHTNNKVVITVYLYNRNKKFFLYKLKDLSMPNLVRSDLKNKKFLLQKQKNEKRKTLSGTNPELNVNYLTKILKSFFLTGLKDTKKIKKHRNLFSKELSLNDNKLLKRIKRYNKKMFQNAFEILFFYMYYTKMLSHNNNKFKNWFLLGLKKIVYKLYNKKVEFNFVSLKYLHLNSDIFTNSIVTKLKNRDNGLLRVLKKALRLAKVPSKNRNFKYNTNFNNTTAYYDKQAFLTTTRNSERDNLHILLSSLFGDKVMNKNLSTITLKANNINSKKLNILQNIKSKTVFGVRLEAAGRLTKRLTASRSLFKLRYKGGLRNLDLVRNPIPSVMLKGNIKPNVQYTLINSKTRNGSFGLKGWINGF